MRGGRGGDIYAFYKTGFLVNMLVLADAGLHPADVFTVTENPLLKTLGGEGGGEYYYLVALMFLW